MSHKKEIYLGDGAYAKFTGFSIEVYAPRQVGLHHIDLEPKALSKLIDFACAWGFVIEAPAKECDCEDSDAT